MTSVAVTSDRLALDALARSVSTSGGLGAIATFVGIVRDNNQGRRVLHLEYEAYEPLAVKALKQIKYEAAREWPDAQLAIHHRVGRLAIGEASVMIAAA